jgi:hypothetical protein
MKWILKSLDGNVPNFGRKYVQENITKELIQILFVCVFRIYIFYLAKFSATPVRRKLKKTLFYHKTYLEPIFFKLQKFLFSLFIWYIPTLIVFVPQFFAALSHHSINTPIFQNKYFSSQSQIDFSWSSKKGCFFEEVSF